MRYSTDSKFYLQLFFLSFFATLYNVTLRNTERTSIWSARYQGIKEISWRAIEGDKDITEMKKKIPSFTRKIER